MKQVAHLIAVSGLLLLSNAIPLFAAMPTWARKATVFPSECDPKARGEYKNQTPRGALISSAAPCIRISIPSPDGKSNIEVKYRKTEEEFNSAYLVITTPDNGTREADLPHGFQDIDLLWAPDSKAFFVNGGNGGGYWGFWVYVYMLSDPKLEALNVMHEAQRDMVRLFPPCRAAYLDARVCRAMEHHPDYSNMSAIDWVRDSSVIVVMAEVPCAGSYGGIMCQVMGYELHVPTGRILRRMTARQFGAVWQGSMAWKFRIPDPPDYLEK
jgi:hypothetical protein